VEYADSTQRSLVDVGKMGAIGGVVEDTGFGGL